MNCLPFKLRQKLECVDSLVKSIQSYSSRTQQDLIFVLCSHLVSTAAEKRYHLGKEECDQNKDKCHGKTDEVIPRGIKESAPYHGGMVCVPQ